jgi:hypothetical protein
MSALLEAADDWAAWSQQELDRRAEHRRQLQQPTTVTDWGGYHALWELWGQLRAGLGEITDPTERQATRDLMDETMLEIERAKAQLGSQIRQWFLARYPKGGRP